MTVFPNIKPQKKNMYKKTVNGFVPKSVVVPLCQDMSGRCEWLVNYGDTVEEGQLIAVSEKTDGVYSSVYSPIPGKISGKELCICPDGRTCDAMRIELQGSFSFLGKKREPISSPFLTARAIFESINKSGLVNTFIANEPILLAEEIKRASAEQTPLLVVRLFDEDPSRLTDCLITQFFFENVMKGAFMTAEACGAAGIIFITEKKCEIPAELPSGKTPFAFIKADSQKYPSGLKNEIIRIVRKNGRESWMRALSKKSLFTDASTMLETFRTVGFDMPVIDRYVHISGDCVPASGLIKVSIGTTLQALAEQCGNLIKTPGAVIVNGLVSGMSAGTLSAPVTKYVKSVAFVPTLSAPDQRQTECVRCGNCRRICPQGLSPDVIFRLLKNRTKNGDAAFLQSASLCDNCGLCNASCPARLPLCQVIYKGIPAISAGTEEIEKIKTGNAYV